MFSFCNTSCTSNLQWDQKSVENITWSVDMWILFGRKGTYITNIFYKPSLICPNINFCFIQFSFWFVNIIKLFFIWHFFNIEKGAALWSNYSTHLCMNSSNQNSMYCFNFFFKYYKKQIRNKQYPLIFPMND